MNSPQHGRRLISALALAWLLALPPGQAAVPWFPRVWRVDDGLPGDNVTGVAQTRDGYLWIATQSGLARFDGIRFNNISLPGSRPHPIIRAMCRDQADRLWPVIEGQSYRNVYKDVLGASGWIVLDTIVADTINESFADNTAPPVKRFYRIVIP